MSEAYNQYIEDVLELNKDWEDFVMEYSHIFGKVYSNLLLEKIKLKIDNINDTKMAYGLTQRYKEGLLVTVDPEYFYMGHYPRRDVLLHEMAHCCVYFDTGRLDPSKDGGHGSEWLKYVNLLNNEPGIDIRSEVDDDYDMILAESKKRILEKKGNSNDDNFSHAPEKLSLKEIKYLFNNPEELSKYFFEHPEFTSTSQCGSLDWAMEMGKEKGFEEGFLPESIDAIIQAVETIYSFTDLSNSKDKITLYRGVVIFDVEPDTKEPGICWSYEKDGAEEWLDALDTDSDPESAPCIMKGVTTLDNVDWLMTVLLLTDTPEEKEIRIWDDSKIKVDDWEVL